MRRILVIALALVLAMGALIAVVADGELPLTEDGNSPEKGDAPVAAALQTPSMSPETAVIRIDKTHFPDKAFRACVAADLDENGDGVLSEREREENVIDVSGKGIGSLAGIEFFPELEYLYFSDNAVTALKLSENPKLIEIDGSRNQLRRLDLSGNARLEVVVMAENRLKSVDVDGCRKLRRLNVAGNALADIDVSRCARLRLLDVSDNRLTGLRLSKNRRLEELYCANNALKKLSLKNNSRLLKLDAEDNRLASVDIRACARLAYLDVRDNLLKKLDVSGKRSLIELYCDDNRIKALTLDGCRSLEILTCAENRLSALDAGGCRALSTLDCARNWLRTLDIAGCRQLASLCCADNRLNALDVGGYGMLERLDCARNRLETLNVRDAAALETLRCQANRLRSLDVGGDGALTTLACWGNKIGLFDIATLPDGLHALAADESLRVQEADMLCWRADAPTELSFPRKITLLDGARIVCGQEYVFKNLKRDKSNARAQYPELSDTEFANFRAVRTTGIGMNALYRSSTPIRSILGRDRQAADAMSDAGVRTVLNLCDNAGEMQRRKGYPGSDYSTKNLFATHIHGCSPTPKKMRQYVEALRYMIDHDGPYLIHCVHGRDRTGVLCALLECLMGASADEVAADYMKSYANYNRVAVGTELYDYILNERIREHLTEGFDGVDIFAGDADPAACAEALLLRSGMTAEEIAALKARLARGY